MSTRHRPSPLPQPHITIPPGAAPPASSSTTTSTGDFDSRTSDSDSLNLWHDDYRDLAYTPDTSITHNPSFSITGSSSRPTSRASSVHETGSPRIVFPEPHPFSASLRPSHSQTVLRHRSTKSDTNVSFGRAGTNRGESRPPSFISTGSSPEFTPSALSDELSNLSLDSEEGIQRFQDGLLDEKDEAWYRLVPPEAREVLDKKEVQRQSIIFEFIASERDYVKDLKLVQDVFVEPLFATSPVPQSRVKQFVSEVFYNLNEILEHHDRMLKALFTRQQEQHPLIQSVADIVLDTSLAFRTSYEKYIKHYPLAEAHHRKELKRNPKYQYFLAQCSQDPRTRKRDFIIFLNRPITRLPRTILMLEQIQKFTALDHPDQEVLPLTLNILREFVKSTQPGIEAAEGKVKFWNLCETLAWQKGEIIDLDLYDESRTLLYQGTLARRYKAEVGYSWADLHIALLDNYLLLTKKDVRPSGIYKHSVVSRPIPIEYLRLASFDAPPENRKDKTSSSVDHGKLFGIDSFRSRYRSMYPFTLYHASAVTTRRYTLYANSEKEREKWRKALVEAIGVRKVRQESNMLLAPHTVADSFSKGRIKSVVLLSNSGKSLIAIGCPSGIYVAPRGSNDYKRVLKMTNIVSLHAIQQYNKILVHSDEGLDAYSLDLMARVALGTSRPQDLDASRERISGQDVAVMFVRVETLNTRTIVLYTTKSFMQVTLHSVEVMNPVNHTTSPRRSTSGLLSFRRFVEPVWIPKDSHNITTWHRNIGVCAERGIHVLDSANLKPPSNVPVVVPTFSDSNNAPMQALKQRCSGARPLGLVKTDDNELLVIFDELGCYISRRGVPCRSSGYLRWETKATSYAKQGPHILLFSSEFVEIRHAATGRLVQVVEGQDIRCVHASDRAIMVAMRGTDGKTDKLVELIETADLMELKKQDSKSAALWDEWDMS